MQIIPVVSDLNKCRDTSTLVKTNTRPKIKHLPVWTMTRSGLIRGFRESLPFLVNAFMSQCADLMWAIVAKCLLR